MYEKSRVHPRKLERIRRGENMAQATHTQYNILHRLLKILLVERGWCDW